MTVSVAEAFAERNRGGPRSGRGGCAGARPNERLVSSGWRPARASGRRQPPPRCGRAAPKPDNRRAASWPAGSRLAYAARPAQWHPRAGARPYHGGPMDALEDGGELYPALEPDAWGRLDV